MNHSTHHHTMIRPYDRYRVTDGSLHPLSGGAVAFNNNARDDFRVYPEQLIHLLTNCKEFKTLDEHARDYLRMRRRQKLSQPARSPLQRLHRYLIAKMTSAGGVLPLNEKEVQAVRGRLEEFVKAGLLVSEEQLRQSVKKALSGFEPAFRAPKKIAILGIPTRNRDGNLLECLESYLENFKMNDRVCIVHIVDDADEEVAPIQRFGNLKQLFRRYDADFMWSSRRERLTFAGQLASFADLPKAVTEFALLGNSYCDIRTGSARNMLLLMAAGKPSVQVDDDTICRILSSPGINDGMAISSKSDCNSYWYYNHQNTINEGLTVKETDFLSLHEDLLGKHPASLIREQSTLNIDNVRGRFLEKLSRPETRIAVTHTGALGDSGLFRHWQRLCFDGDSFRRLIDNGSNYKNHLCTRQLFRGAVQTTISGGPFCMAMNIGLDTSRLLPPFMPVQRNQDGIFGQLLYLCFKQACRGYLPHAIIHDPPNRAARVDLSFALSVGPLRTPDILQAILWSLYQWPFGEDPAKNLFVVGRYLSDLGQLPLSQFKGKVRELCWQLIRNQMNFLHRCLDERYDAPGYWQADVKQVLANFQELMKQQDLCIPCDLPGSASERLELFRELVGKFGQVLIHWPAMWEAAVNLNKNSEMSKQASMFE